MLDIAIEAILFHDRDINAHVRMVSIVLRICML